MQIGYTMMGEHAGPKALVEDVGRAEAAGFDSAVISDHFFPWLDEQGHAPTRGRCSVRPPRRPRPSRS